MSEMSAQKVGVIDIGSNSIRLVIFSISGCAIFPTFNEKVMAGLGKGLSETGLLSSSGRVLALAALRRFRAILEGLGVTQVRAVATAAVRVAKDGPDFAREAAQAAGVRLAILSGLDEGRLSALGVATGFHAPKGLVADLGGSSLELFDIGSDDVGGETHMLGPLALARSDVSSEAEIRAGIRTVLAQSERVRTGTSTIYAVGGAWRAFAKVVIEHEAYPLQVLHGYVMPASRVRDMARHVFEQRGTKKLSNLAGRRAAQLHITALVLDELAQMTGAEDVVISSYGLREGVVAETLGLSGADALIDGLSAFADLNAAQRRFSETLYQFTRPVFDGRAPQYGDWAAENRLHRAACYLVESASKYHPDHRDHMGFDKTLYAPLSGVSHAERVFLAATVGWRYSRRFSVPEPFPALASSKQMQRARQLGQAMRLGAVFSGRSADILSSAKLERREHHLVLCLPRSKSAMVSETVERRLNQTAEALELSPAVSLS